MNSLGRRMVGCRRAGRIRRRWDEARAAVAIELGELDAAEPFAASALRLRVGTGYEREAALTTVTLATIHVRAGEPTGLPLAKKAVDGVALLRSVRARERLGPLADALDARPGADTRELAGMARRVAASRR